MVARLPLHPSRGIKKWSEADDFCINDDDVVGWLMAWSIMEFRFVGVRSWPSLIAHRFGSKIGFIESFFNSTGKIGILISWLITQYLVFFTWLIFRVEDVSVLIPSMKTFLGIGGHFDLQEMYDALPEIKLLTFFLAIGFVLLHGLSGKTGRRENVACSSPPFDMGAICGFMLTMAFYLRPAETIDFIYFRF